MMESDSASKTLPHCQVKGGGQLPETLIKAGLFRRLVASGGLLEATAVLVGAGS